MTKWGLMMVRLRAYKLPIALLLVLTAFACTIRGIKTPPHRTVASTEGPFKSKPGRLSGVLVLHDGCESGFYQIKLQGVGDRSTVQVEAQADESGHFSISAPNGKYIMAVNNKNCGVKQPVELEDNTDHMILVDILGTTEYEKDSYEKGGRLPASVLVPTISR